MRAAGRDAWAPAPARAAGGPRDGGRHGGGGMARSLLAAHRQSSRGRLRRRLDRLERGPLGRLSHRPAVLRRNRHLPLNSAPALAEECPFGLSRPCHDPGSRFTPSPLGKQTPRAWRRSDASHPHHPRQPLPRRPIGAAAAPPGALRADRARHERDLRPLDRWLPLGDRRALGRDHSPGSGLQPRAPPAADRHELPLLLRDRDRSLLPIQQGGQQLGECRTRQSRTSQLFGRHATRRGAGRRAPRTTDHEPWWRSCSSPVSSSSTT